MLLSTSTTLAISLSTRLLNGYTAENLGKEEVESVTPRQSNETPDTSQMPECPPSTSKASNQAEQETRISPTCSLEDEGDGVG